ncbi:MAG: 23S rRNA (guanosine-2'-O-)-methyltransferase RlmB [Saprospiraceae bacterium]|jgi:TrmH family RNA methyltransferase|nr:23S rRNA (guanosine-2'-O-)-methyltransferase RlmB [Saprospiraceae bacterium]
MLTKSEKNWIKSLQRREERYRQKLFVAEGAKLVGDLLVSKGLRCRMLVASVARAGELDPIMHSAEEVRVVDESFLQAISSLKTGGGFLGIFTFPEFDNHEPPEDYKLALYLDRISDPGNLGTIVRSADWFGLKKIFCSPDCVDPYNAKCVQASMSSIARVELAQRDWESMISLFQGVEIYAADAAGRPYSSIESNRVRILCIGSESHGICDAIRASCTGMISIPRDKDSKAESLNAAVAASILLAWKFSS